MASKYTITVKKVFGAEISKNDATFMISSMTKNLKLGKTVPEAFEEARNAQKVDEKVDEGDKWPHTKETKDRKKPGSAMQAFKEAQKKEDEEEIKWPDAKNIQEMMDMDPVEFIKRQLPKSKQSPNLKKEQEVKVEKKETEICSEKPKERCCFQHSDDDSTDLDETDDEESFKEGISQEFFDKFVRSQMRKGNYHMDDLDNAFKRFLLSKVIEKEKEQDIIESEKQKIDEVTNIRDCFGPADACHNCESKGGESFSKPECTSNEHCMNLAYSRDELKRCKECYVVAYCSEKCQKEHWNNNHKKMCKILSGKNKIKDSKHIFEDCEVCVDRIESSCDKKESLLLPCVVATIQIYLVNYYWQHFGYHRDQTCNCSPQSRKLRVKTMTFPMQSPFIMGEISGEYLGWIDEHLATLGIYLVSIEAKYQDEIKEFEIKGNMDEIAMFILGIRANYWYYVTSEKNRAMSQVLFAQKLHEISHDDTTDLLKVDTAFKKLNIKSVWWETFLFQLAAFYRRLRQTRYILLNTDSIPPKRKKEFSKFEELHRHALGNLSRSVEMLLPFAPSKRPGDLLPSFFVVLSSGTRCSICSINIGGNKAQYQLQVPIDQNLWKVDPSQALEDIMLIRYPQRPIIFDDMGEKGLLVTCGVKTSCNIKALQVQLENYDRIAKSNINFLFKSRRCQGCLQFTYESHRCSGCRAVRYCSQGCLEKDWKSHQDFCRSDQKDEIRPEINSRKLKPSDKKEYFEDCVNWLGKSDPIVQVIMSSWKDKGLGYEQICEEESELQKKKKKKKNGKNPSRNRVNEDQKKIEEEPKIVTNKEARNYKKAKNSGSDSPKSGQSSSPTFDSKETGANLEEMFQNGVKVVVCSVDDTGKGVSMKPFITEDDEGNKTIYKENMPEFQKKQIDEKKWAENLKRTGAKEGKGQPMMREIARTYVRREKPKQSKPTPPPSPKKKALSQENFGKLQTIVDEHRSKSLKGRHFEIRHLKKQPHLNEELCEVVNVEFRNDLFNPRVSCRLKREDKIVSLKLLNLVDIGAGIESMANVMCMEGKPHQMLGNGLTDAKVKYMLQQTIAWAKENDQTRPDEIYRLEAVQKYLTGEEKVISCMANPQYGTLESMTEDECFSACLAAVRPGCVGDTLVDFNHFNQAMCSCSDQLMKRFREFVVTGMCHLCQVYYMERTNDEIESPLGGVFVQCSRVISLDRLKITSKLKN